MDQRRILEELIKLWWNAVRKLVSLARIPDLYRESDRGRRFIVAIGVHLALSSKYPSIPVQIMAPFELGATRSPPCINVPRYSSELNRLASSTTAVQT